MSLTENYNYESEGHSRFLEIEAGAATTFYQGALVNIGTDGYLKLAEDIANEVPIGIVVKDHVADGSSHKKILVETSKAWIAHTGAAQTDIGALFYATADDTLADSATNVGPCGVCIGWKTGYLLIDFSVKKLVAAVAGDSKNWPFTTSGNYTFDTTVIEVTGGNAQLKDIGLDDNLVLYWKCDEASWNGTPGEITDSSPSGYDGTGQNGATTASGGKIDRCGTYDGTNDYAEEPSTSLTHEQTYLTYVAWVKLDTLGDDEKVISSYRADTIIVSMGLGGTGSGGNDDVNIEIQNGFDGDYFYTTGNIISTGAWQLWVMTFDGTGATNADKLKYYLNAIQKTLTYNSTVNSDTGYMLNEPFYVGSRDGAGNYIDGLIDEVGVYQRTLTQADINLIYNSGNARRLWMYASDSPKITPNTGFVFTAAISVFTETATKPGSSQIKYQVSSDNGTTWKYWGGSSWDTITGAQTDEWYYNNEANLATEINTNISSLASSGTFLFRAFLYTPDGTNRPQLDNIYVEYP
jgi:hypothetical protein